MNYPRVLCVGEMLFDRIADQLGRPLEEVESWTNYPGGAPANVACALVKLGTTAGFIGCIGQDEWGAQLVSLLQNMGVDFKGVQRHPKAPTRIVYVLRDEAGECSFPSFDLYDTSEFADAYLQADLLPRRYIQKADFLVLGTLELAFPETRAAIAKAVAIAEQSDTLIFVDVNRRDKFWPNQCQSFQPTRELVERANFLKCTDEEAMWLFNTTDAGVIAKCLDRVRGVLVTAGERGCSYWLAGHEGELPGFSVPIEDATGAGDGFSAGILHQLCRRGLNSLNRAETVREIVTYGSAVGAITVTKPGAIAAQPTSVEVDEFLKIWLPRTSSNSRRFVSETNR
ncbi:MAG: carbohydrate kinase [Cyanobacteriota bacterium]|nr:carbohydrate kinase [Cyanobacteriota bacterium]